MRLPMLALGLALAASPMLAGPNILLVIADDMGLDASPCHARGDARLRMPNLAALCETGMVFDAAYVAPTCSPTRAMMMTGKYPSQTGVGGAIARQGGGGLADSERSLFDAMTETAPDYATALIGKWHLSGDARDLDHPARLGITEYFGLFSGAIRDYTAWQGVENGQTVQIEGYSTPVLTDRAIAWTAAQETPWFLWLAYNAPHTPFHAPPANLHSYGEIDTSERALRRDPDIAYFAALEALDTEFGRLLDTVGDDTVVIFLGDNGTPNQVVRGDYANGAKGSIFDAGTHVPFVVSGLNTGRSGAPVVATDVFATVLDIAGGSGAPESSYSLVPVLEGPQGTSRTAAYVEHFGANAPRGQGSYGWSVTTEGFQLVAAEGREMALFDMSDDPGQTRDISGAMPDMVARLVAVRAQMLR
jgi:arylsulfatase A-like enzyme